METEETQYDLDKVQYAGFWMRFLALLIDYAMFAVIFLLFFFTIKSAYDIEMPILAFWHFLIILVNLAFLFCYLTNFLMILANLYLYYLILEIIIPSSVQFGYRVDLIGPFIFLIFFIFAYSMYFILMHGYFGQTFGKMATGIQVRDEDLMEITLGEAIRRFFYTEISKFFPFGLGFIWAGFDEEKQSWHDKVVNTTVAYKNTIFIKPPPPPPPPDDDTKRTRPKGKEFGEIVFGSGVMKGKRFTLRGNRIRIGRNQEENDIYIQDPEKHVSRIQCEIVKIQNRYYIQNMSTKTPTKLNGKNLNQRTPLRSSDIIKFSNQKAKIFLFE